MCYVHSIENSPCICGKSANDDIEIKQLIKGFHSIFLNQIKYKRDEGCIIYLNFGYGSICVYMGFFWFVFFLIFQSIVADLQLLCFSLFFFNMWPGFLRVAGRANFFDVSYVKICTVQIC
jgi:hypothetical protein